MSIHDYQKPEEKKLLQYIRDNAGKVCTCNEAMKTCGYDDMQAFVQTLKRTYSDGYITVCYISYALSLLAVFSTNSPAGPPAVNKTAKRVTKAPKRT